ncbi:MAG: 50S ribosomal protein L29 [Elusimicrobiota bacterium]
MPLNVKDLRNETVTELENRMRAEKKKLMEMRFKHASGALDNPIDLRNSKRDIARIMTVIREKEVENEKQ